MRFFTSKLIARLLKKTGNTIERAELPRHLRLSIALEGKMSSDDPEETSAQPPRGRPFAPGNPGRPPGSKNKTTLFAAGLSSEDAAEIMRVGVEMAKARNERLAKLFIERMLPKQRPVQVDLPHISFASDAVDAHSVIIAAITAGQLSPSEGLAIASIVRECARTVNIADLETRLEAIEAKLQESR
jgi:hypothetical protein